LKIVVVSDTHGNYPAAVRAVSLAAPDLVVHLGDLHEDALLLETAIGIPVISVPGNCDSDAAAPRRIVREIGKTVFFICHGDRFHVKSGLRRLEEAAAAAGASVVLFGHTHRPLVEMRNGTLFVNPGTLEESARERTYAIVAVTGSGVFAEIETLSRD
jgi:uncharacterized protein